MKAFCEKKEGRRPPPSSPFPLSLAPSLYIGVLYPVQEEEAAAAFLVTAKEEKRRKGGRKEEAEI